MSNIALDKLKECIVLAKTQYYQLVLLVGESGTGKTGILKKLAEEYNTKIINLNMELSARLLELTEQQRSIKLPGFLAEIAEEYPEPIIFDNIELLFDKSLKLNPLTLVQEISRNLIVVSSWNGSCHQGNLIYAESSHPEYRKYDNIEVLVVNAVEA